MNSRFPVVEIFTDQHHSLKSQEHSKETLLRLNIDVVEANYGGSRKLSMALNCLTPEKSRRHASLNSPVSNEEMHRRSLEMIEDFNSTELCESPSVNMKGYVEIRLPKLRFSDSNPFKSRKMSTGTLSPNSSILMKSFPCIRNVCEGDDFETLSFECINSSSTSRPT